MSLTSAAAAAALHLRFLPSLLLLLLLLLAMLTSNCRAPLLAADALPTASATASATAISSCADSPRSLADSPAAHHTQQEE
jgi:hypothetical protein